MKCRDVRLAYSNNLKSNASIHQLAELHKQLDEDLWWQRNGRSVVVRDGVADLLCWRPAMLFLFLLFRRASRPRLLSVGFAPAKYLFLMHSKILFSGTNPSEVSLAQSAVAVVSVNNLLMHDETVNTKNQ